jgi:phage terminase large subunit GpA-like protein
MKKLSSGYLSYIRSDAWFIIAQRIRLRDKVCQGCGTSKRLDVHHKTYQRFKHERDEDLVLICRQCHERVHKIQKKGSLKKLTEKVLATTRRQITKFEALEEKCRKCNGILILRHNKLTKKRLLLAYHFCKWKQCVSCKSLFMLEDFKKYPHEECDCERE